MTECRNEGQAENSITPLTTFAGGGIKIAREYDQKIPHSQTADERTAA